MLPATLAGVGGKIPPSAPIADVEGRFYRLTRWVQRHAVTVIADTNADSPEFGAWLDQVPNMPGVVGTSIRPDTPDGVTVVDITPAGTSQGSEASMLVAQLRSTPAAFDTQVGGIAAELIDVKARLSERLPFAALTVVAATLVLLFLMTGSIMVPIKAVT